MLYYIHLDNKPVWYVRVCIYISLFFTVVVDAVAVVSVVVVAGCSRKSY